MTLEEYTHYYRNRFLPAYADAVALLADKPTQLVVEQENSLSHLISYLRNNSDIDNLKKAKGHIERATLDSYKLAWVEVRKRLSRFIELDRNNIYVSFNLPAEETLRKIKDFDKLANEARRLESINLGQNSTVALDKYKEAVDVGVYLLMHTDTHKYVAYKKKGILAFIHNHIIGFIIGFITSIIATLAFNNFLV